MTNPINGLGANSPYTGFAYQNNNNLNSEPERDEAVNTGGAAEHKNVEGSEMLSMMAAQSAQYTSSVAKPTSPNIPKYVTAEQAKDIAEFVTTNFEDAVATNLQAVMQEFPNLSEDAQMTIALNMTDSDFENQFAAN